MTLYVFPTPLVDVRATIAANAARWPSGTTYSEKPALSLGTAPHFQYAWDGTPTQERQRESAAIRLTVWGWKVVTGPNTYAESRDDLTDLASLLHAVFLDGGAGTGGVWRYTEGTGRLPGRDPDTKLPFCTFTLTAETKPSPVA